jgi:DNA gyrase subunit B
MDPERRTLVRITIDDAEKAAEKIRVLMGDEPELRRQFIEMNANLVKDLDI